MPRIPLQDSTSGAVAPVSQQYGGGVPAGYAGEAVGASVEQVGSYAAQIAREERQKTSQLLADQAETDYQSFVGELVYDKFSALRGQDAVAKSEETVRVLSNRRLQMIQDMPAGAAHLFSTSTLRIERFAQNHIYNYTNTQRRVWADQTFTRSVGTSAAKTTAIAGAPVYDAGAALDELRALTQKAERHAATIGLTDPNDVQDFVRKSVAPAADALVLTLAKRGNTDDARTEYARLSRLNLLSPRVTESVGPALDAQDAKRRALTIVGSVSRINLLGKGESDDDGKLDASDYRAKLYEHADDPNFRAVQVEADKEVAAHNARTADIVNDKINLIRTRGSNAAGYFRGVNLGDPDVQQAIMWLKRNGDGGKLSQLNQMEATHKRAELNASTANDKRASQESLGRLMDTLIELNARKPEDVKKVTLENLSAVGAGNVYDLLPGDKTALRSLLNSLQKGDKQAKMIESVKAIATEELVARFPKAYQGADRATTRAKVMPALIKWLEQNPENKDDGKIRDFIRGKVKEVGPWYSKHLQIDEELETANRAAAAGPTAGRAPAPASVQAPQYSYTKDRKWRMNIATGRKERNPDAP